MLIVLDTNVPRHIATTRVVTVGTQESNWGTKKLRCRRLRHESEWLHTRRGIIAHQVRYAVALALNKSQLGLQFAVNGLIELERWNTTPSLDQAGRDIWSLFDPSTLDTAMPTTFIVMGQGIRFKETLQGLSRWPNSSRLKQFLTSFGSNNSQDAFNVWNAEEHSASHFMTIDAKLVKLFRDKNDKLKSPVSVSLPSAVAEQFNTRPVPLKWFAERSESWTDEWLKPE